MYNRIVLIGRLTRDPELRYTPAGHAVASFTVAVDRPVPRDESGKRQADFIDIVTWRKVAEQVGQYLSKGRLVALEGRLQIRSYDDRNGVRRKAAEVVANTVRFLDGRKQTTEAEDEAGIDEETPAQELEPVAASASEGDVAF
jgi:single-strand DNA-binding protein